MKLVASTISNSLKSRPGQIPFSRAANRASSPTPKMFKLLIKGSSRTSGARLVNTFRYGERQETITPQATATEWHG